MGKVNMILNWQQMYAINVSVSVNVSGLKLIPFFIGKLLHPSGAFYEVRELFYNYYYITHNFHHF